MKSVEDCDDREMGLLVKNEREDGGDDGGSLQGSLLNFGS